MKRKVLLLFALVFMAFSGNSQVTSVALVGEAAGGWPGDPGNPGPTDVHQMTSSDGENWTLVDVALTDAAVNGGVKFRANNAWTINWGSASFPSGTGTQNGANILPIAGVYTVTFNSTTGVYNFAGGAPIPVVNIVGAATGGTDIAMTATSSESFTATNVTLVDGIAQFSVDGSNFGGDTFPTGVGTDPGLFIPVVAGTYSTITYNIATGDYSFNAAPVFNTIAIVGSGAGGWPNDPQIDANILATTDGINYSGNVAITPGEVKFRANNSWTLNWGGTLFPDGLAVENGSDNIPTNATGYYYVTFSTATLVYSFSIPTVAIVGSGTPGGWPTGAAGEVDPGVMTTADGGFTYTLTGLTLSDGAAKFRANNAWTINWGGNVDPATFPSGVGVQDGTNIPTVAGTYDVTFDRMTGVYNFGVLATENFNKSNFKVYPNPTANNWNFSAVQSIDTIQIIDVLGKTILTVNPKNTTAVIDASSLNAGIYFAKIGTAAATQTIKLVKN